MKRIAMLAAVAVSSLLACDRSHASTLTFQPPVNITTGTISPHFLAVGDFNGDGKPDLAVPDAYANTLYVYLNQGTGTFGAPVVSTVTLSGGMYDLLSGDFNEDGKADLLVSSSGTYGVIVLLGNGDGTFAQQPAIPGSFNFVGYKIADFNKDGHVDVFLGGNGTPYLFLGKGDGTFTQASVGTGSFPGSYLGATAGDFKGNKILDVISPDAIGNVVNYFTGDGKGTLANATQFQVALLSNAASIDTADFNHDGKLDLLLADSTAAGVVLGNGDGTFQTQNSQVIPVYAETTPPSSTVYGAVIVLAADLDQDGSPDAVVLDGNLGLLTLSLNDGKGSFQSTPLTYQFAASSYSLATADFNGDGLPDIVLSNAASKTVSLLLSVKPLIKPTVGLTSSGSNVLMGTPLTFKAAIGGGTAAATGAVTLLDGSSQIGQQTLDSAGDATFSVSNLSTGVHMLSLSYSGDSNYAAATSMTLSQAVTDFQVAVTATSQTVTAGSTASYPLTVTPVAGFTGEVTFTCSGLPSLATCNAPSLTVGASPATGTVTIQTTATTTSLNRRPEGTAWACILLGCFSLCGLRLGKGRPASRRLLPLLLLAFLWGPLACGGGGARQATPGTPVGTSTITITATATQNGVTVSHASTAMLTVQ